MDYEQLQKRYTPQAYSNNQWWYIVAKSGGKMVVLGPYSTEQEASQVAVEKLDGMYEIMQLGTRDRARATQIVRHRMLNTGSDLGQALRRMKHTL